MISVALLLLFASFLILLNNNISNHNRYICDFFYLIISGIIWHLFIISLSGSSSPMNVTSSYITLTSFILSFPQMHFWVSHSQRAMHCSVTDSCLSPLSSAPLLPFASFVPPYCSSSFSNLSYTIYTKTYTSLQHTPLFFPESLWNSVLPLGKLHCSPTLIWEVLTR